MKSTAYYYKTACKLILLFSLMFCTLTARSTPYNADTLHPDKVKQVIGWIPRIEKDLRECEAIRSRATYLEKSLLLKEKLLINSESIINVKAGRITKLEATLNKKRKSGRILKFGLLGAGAYIFRNQLKTLFTK